MYSNQFDVWDYNSCLRAPERPQTIYINRNYHALESNILESKTILVNPNFKGKILVNPNFNAPRSNIYVNPEILKPKEPIPVNNVCNVPNSLDDSHLSSSNMTKNINPPTVLNNLLSSSNRIVNTRKKIVNKPIHSSVNKINPKPKSVITISSKFKLVKKNLSPNKSLKMCSTPVLVKNKIKITKSSYKFVKNQNSSSPIRIIKYRSPNKRYSQFKISNKTKIAHTSIKIKRPASVKVCSHYQLLNKSIKVAERRRSIELKNKKVITQFSIKIKPKSTFSQVTQNRRYNWHKSYNSDNLKTVIIKTRHKILRRRLISLNSSQNNSPTKLKKSTPSKNKVLKKNLSSKNMKLNYIPCDKFKKTGQCLGLKLGRCPKVHNLNFVNLCPKFLQGACLKNNCLLSHKVSVHKVPTCKYFLEGSCTREKCPYLHVKISGKAEICPDFLKGYCIKGSDCTKRHQYLCPEFEKSGACSKIGCQYPHGAIIRQYSTKILTNIVRNKVKRKVVKPLIAENTDNQHLRYYVDEIDQNCDQNADGCELESKNSDLAKQLINRPKLGTLPSFIPFS